MADVRKKAAAAAAILVLALGLAACGSRVDLAGTTTTTPKAADPPAAENGDRWDLSTSSVSAAGTADEHAYCAFARSYATHAVDQVLAGSDTSEIGPLIPSLEQLLPSDAPPVIANDLSAAAGALSSDDLAMAKTKIAEAIGAAAAYCG